jgi:hypothetical protein
MPIGNWHMNGGAARMIANYLPLNNDPHVPEIVKDLRQDLDERLMDLYKRAVELLKQEPVSASETVHVPYQAAGLHVTAVYHVPTGHFTQIIARPVADVHLERPEYTISLFLAHTSGAKADG